MIYVCIPVALLIGFLLGHAHAVWSRTRFIHSLMPAGGEHTDFEEAAVTERQPESPWGDIQRRGYHVADARLDRVRPGGVGHAVHDQSSTDPEARNHVR